MSLLTFVWTNSEAMLWTASDHLARGYLADSPTYHARRLMSRTPNFCPSSMNDSRISGGSWRRWRNEEHFPSFRNYSYLFLITAPNVQSMRDPRILQFKFQEIPNEELTGNYSYCTELIPTGNLVRAAARGGIVRVRLIRRTAHQQVTSLI